VGANILGGISRNEVQCRSERCTPHKTDVIRLKLCVKARCANKLPTAHVAADNWKRLRGPPKLDITKASTDVHNFGDAWI
jgi:hypothetical protein